MAGATYLCPIDYSPLYALMTQTRLAPWLRTLPLQVDTALDVSRHGDLRRWLTVLAQLPQVSASSVDLNADSIRAGEPEDCVPETREVLEQGLRQLHPWRKGPYSMHGVQIEAEWRSNWKWNRLCNHITPLQERLVLDVGCGNGYHCWRMVGAGAALVIGIDPMLLRVIQFHAIRHFLGQWPAYVLPLGIEDLLPNLQAFDTVFSMGVLYHRRSPLDHLLELKAALRNGGELVLETLVIEGKRDQVLVPEGRYARMRNVWFIPSCPTLASWLRRCGYRQIRLIDVTPTTTAEQRSTDWMTFESLANCLDPSDPSRTVEGLPAPKRAIFLANSP